MPLPTPPLSEQRAIVAFLDRETTKIDTLIAKVQQVIERLREYRTALISAAVTGKIDVRQAREIRQPATEHTGRCANVPFQRAVFAAEIVHQLHEEPTFGHVKFMKVLFLTEQACEVDLGTHYHRAAAGPYDNRALRSIDKQLRNQDWYEAKEREGGYGYRYVPLGKAGEHRQYFERHFAEQAETFQKVIELLRGLNSEQCELIATLYAAWQDLLARQDAVTDEQIIWEVLHNWHESKSRIEEQRWEKALQWMKDNGLVPKKAKPDTAHR